MQCVSKITALREHVTEWRNAGQSIVLVPTMGNLHDGHLALVLKAQEVADRTIVSIFVNPTQFVQGEDYESYPRTLDEDIDKLSGLRTDLVFHPEVEEIYPGGLQGQTCVTVPELDNIFCGAFRPGHFSGVATVVTKLFNMVEPDIAIFGEKDYQQLLVIRRLATDLCFPIKIIGVPTIREEDGLALSSRNGYLSANERNKATLLYKTLVSISDAVDAGKHDFIELEMRATENLKNAGFKPEYVKICNADNLGKPAAGDLVVLTAAWLGKTRLIDNVIIRR
ncbi:MAG: pantoate--beta-alanine ligase [Gammaproteobacteria bacterium]|nr:pantoate--beta-alanine ligase [Gammaproteobacteria bacterium]